MTDKIISIRLNAKELQNIKTITRKYKVNNLSTFIKEVLFAEIKPFLSPQERFLLETAIIELNAVGRNLNQLLKYKAHNDAVELVQVIKQKVINLEKTL